MSAQTVVKNLVDAAKQGESVNPRDVILQLKQHRSHITAGQVYALTQAFATSCAFFEQIHDETAAAAYGSIIEYLGSLRAH